MSDPFFGEAMAFFLWPSLPVGPEDRTGVESESYPTGALPSRLHMSTAEKILHHPFFARWITAIPLVNFR
jgi:hypothetical protein